ncbi:hypothetical protein V2G26_015661 [Clonostachys chloroleuca]
MQRGGTGANFWALNGPHHCPGTASTSKLVLRQAGRILAPSESPPEGFLFGKELEFAQLQKDGNGGQELRWLTEAITTHHMVRKAVPGRCEGGNLHQRNYHQEINNLILFTALWKRVRQIKLQPYFFSHEACAWPGDLLLIFFALPQSKGLEGNSTTTKEATSCSW